jgi:hypothetical protein
MREKNLRTPEATGNSLLVQLMQSLSIVCPVVLQSVQLAHGFLPLKDKMP